MDELMKDPAREAQPDLNASVTVVDVTFRTGGKVYYFDPGALEIPAGAHVIIDTARGVEFGTCVAAAHAVRLSDAVLPLRPVLRIATEADERTAAENREKEKRAYDVCLQKIAEQGLEMQLVSAEYAFDGSKILFFFTADGRVDFRELVKSLAAVLRTRIELRQIGVRDKAKMVGGLGVCGRPFCCSQFLDEFQPVSIKMAKVQNLSLNPTKISGTCGRLMCCLKYEQEAYEDLLRTSPKNESFVDTPDGRGTITEVNLLRQSVKVRMEDHPEEIHSYPIEAIYVLRSGKAHKNDPPIPRELAPISGNRELRTRLRSSAPALEPLEPVVIRSTAEPAHREPEASEQPQRRNRRNRGRRAENAAKTPEKPAKAQEKPAKAPEKPAKTPEKPPKAGKSKEKAKDEKHAAQKPPREEGAKKQGRRRHYRRKPEQK